MTTHDACPNCGYIRSCPTCGEPVTGRKRNTYCSTSCYQAAVQARRDNLLEDVEFMHDNGASPHEIAARLGKTPETISRAMYRAGRPDLATVFAAPRRRDRKHPCIDCGEPVSRKAKRCVKCAHHVMWAVA